MAGTLIAVNDILRTRACCYAPGVTQIAYNTWDVVMQAVDPGGTLEDFAVSFEAFWGRNLYPPILSSQASYQGTDVARIGGGLPTNAYRVVDFLVGTAGANMIPPALAPVLRKRTNGLGRNGQGRVYLPFGDQVFILATGEVSAAAIDVIIAAQRAQTLAPQTVIGGGGVSYTFQFVVTIDPVLGVYEPITQCFTSQLLGSQHRRGDYGKHNVPWV